MNIIMYTTKIYENVLEITNSEVHKEIKTNLTYGENTCFLLLKIYLLFYKLYLNKIGKCIRFILNLIRSCHD